MNNLMEICKTKADRDQLQLGENIENTLLKQGKKVHISYTNLNYAKGKGYTVRIYENKYDFRQYNLKFLYERTVDEYIICINYMDKNNRYNLHKSTVDERYLIDILEEQEIYYNVESDFLYLDDEEYSIDVTEIAELQYIKDDLCVFITQENGDKIKLDLDEEKIIYLDEEDDNAEPITIELIEEVISKWNKLNFWCSLAFKDNSIYILDKDTNNLSELIDIDNIEEIRLKENELVISFVRDDEYGFNSCFIDDMGIGY